VHLHTILHFNLRRIRLAAEIETMIAIGRGNRMSPSPPTSPHPSFWSIISSDASPMYSFPLPFVARAWSSVVGAKPLVVLVGSEFHSKSKATWIQVLFAALKSFDIKFITIDPRPASSSTFSQLVRLFAFKLADIHPNDYVTASDR
jgi:hypothetical protein